MAEEQREAINITPSSFGYETSSHRQLWQFDPVHLKEIRAIARVRHLRQLNNAIGLSNYLLSKKIYTPFINNGLLISPLQKYYLHHIHTIPSRIPPTLGESSFQIAQQQQSQQQSQPQLPAALQKNNLPIPLTNPPIGTLTATPTDNNNNNNNNKDISNLSQTSPALSTTTPITATLLPSPPPTTTATSLTPQELYKKQLSIHFLKQQASHEEQTRTPYQSPELRFTLGEAHKLPFNGFSWLPFPTLNSTYFPQPSQQPGDPSQLFGPAAKPIMLGTDYELPPPITPLLSQNEAVSTTLDPDDGGDDYSANPSIPPPPPQIIPLSTSEEHDLLQYTLWLLFTHALRFPLVEHTYDKMSDLTHLITATLIHRLFLHQNVTSYPWRLTFSTALYLAHKIQSKYIGFQLAYIPHQLHFNNMNIAIPSHPLNQSHTWATHLSPSYIANLTTGRNDPFSFLHNNNKNNKSTASIEFSSTYKHSPFQVIPIYRTPNEQWSTHNITVEGVPNSLPPLPPAHILNHTPLFRPSQAMFGSLLQPHRISAAELALLHGIKSGIEVYTPLPTIQSLLRQFVNIFQWQPVSIVTPDIEWPLGQTYLNNTHSDKTHTVTDGDDGNNNNNNHNHHQNNNYNNDHYIAKMSNTPGPNLVHNTQTQLPPYYHSSDFHAIISPQFKLHPRQRVMMMSNNYQPVAGSNDNGGDDPLKQSTRTNSTMIDVMQTGGVRFHTAQFVTRAALVFESLDTPSNSSLIYGLPPNTSNSNPDQTVEQTSSSSSPSSIMNQSVQIVPFMYERDMTEYTPESKLIQSQKTNNIKHLYNGTSQLTQITQDGSNSQLPIQANQGNGMNDLNTTRANAQGVADTMGLSLAINTNKQVVPPSPSRTLYRNGGELEPIPTSRKVPKIILPPNFIDPNTNTITTSSTRTVPHITLIQEPLHTRNKFDERRYEQPFNLFTDLINDHLKNIYALSAAYTKLLHTQSDAVFSYTPAQLGVTALFAAVLRYYTSLRLSASSNNYDPLPTDNLFGQEFTELSPTTLTQTLLALQAVYDQNPTPGTPRIPNGDHTPRGLPFIENKLLDMTLYHRYGISFSETTPLDTTSLLKLEWPHDVIVSKVSERYDELCNQVVYLANTVQKGEHNELISSSGSQQRRQLITSTKQKIELGLDVSDEAARLVDAAANDNDDGDAAVGGGGDDDNDNTKVFVENRGDIVAATEEDLSYDPFVTPVATLPALWATGEPSGLLSRGAKEEQAVVDRLDEEEKVLENKRQGLVINTTTTTPQQSNPKNDHEAQRLYRNEIYSKHINDVPIHNKQYTNSRGACEQILLSVTTQLLLFVYATYRETLLLDPVVKAAGFDPNVHTNERETIQHRPSPLAEYILPLLSIIFSTSANFVTKFHPFTLNSAEYLQQSSSHVGPSDKGFSISTALYRSYTLTQWLFSYPFPTAQDSNFSLYFKSLEHRQFYIHRVKTLLSLYANQRIDTNIRKVAQERAAYINTLTYISQQQGKISSGQRFGPNGELLPDVRPLTPHEELMLKNNDHFDRLVGFTKRPQGLGTKPYSLVRAEQLHARKMAFYTRLYNIMIYSTFRHTRGKAQIAIQKNRVARIISRPVLTIKQSLRNQCKKILQLIRDYPNNAVDTQITSYQELQYAPKTNTILSSSDLTKLLTTTLSAAIRTTGVEYDLDITRVNNRHLAFKKAYLLPFISRLGSHYKVLQKMIQIKNETMQKVEKDYEHKAHQLVLRTRSQVNRGKENITNDPGMAAMGEALTPKEQKKLKRRQLADTEKALATDPLFNQLRKYCFRKGEIAHLASLYLFISALIGNYNVIKNIDHKSEPAGYGKRADSTLAQPLSDYDTNYRTITRPFDRFIKTELDLYHNNALLGQPQNNHKFIKKYKPTVHSDPNLGIVNVKQIGLLKPDEEDGDNKATISKKLSDTDGSSDVVDHGVDDDGDDAADDDDDDDDIENFLYSSSHLQVSSSDDDENSPITGEVVPSAEPSPAPQPYYAGYSDDDSDTNTTTTMHDDGGETRSIPTETAFINNTDLLTLDPSPSTILEDDGIQNYAATLVFDDDDDDEEEVVLQIPKRK